MSDAYECDRCGELSTGEPQSTYKQEGRGLAYQASPRSGDLCSACSEKFRDFIEGSDSCTDKSTYEEI